MFKSEHFDSNSCKTQVCDFRLDNSMFRNPSVPWCQCWALEPGTNSMTDKDAKDWCWRRRRLVHKTIQHLDSPSLAVYFKPTLGANSHL